MSEPVILFEYAFSPYSQKIRLLLNAAGTPYQSCVQPPLLPRPDLLRLGITHRRIPLFAIGRDVYCDTSLIFEAILGHLKGAVKIAVHSDDPLYEAWGRATSLACLGLISIDKLPQPLLEDRRDFAPILLRPDFATLAPSSRSELHGRMTYVEEQLLSNSAFVHSDELSVADFHVAMPLRSALFGLGGMKDVPGFGADHFPKVWRLIQSLPPDREVQTLSGDQAIEAILRCESSEAQYELLSDEPLGFERNTSVTVESADSVPGAHLQRGKLIGSTKNEVIIGLTSGIMLHFPRQGYIFRHDSRPTVGL